MNLQFLVFAAITGGIALLTYLQCRGASRGGDDNAEYFLAGRNLSWYFVAGSITLTNLSTDQLVGMNGNQMLLLAWFLYPFTTATTAPPPRSCWKNAMASST